MECETSEAGERRLQHGPAHLLASTRIPGGGCHHDSALDQAGQRFDLLGIVATIGHRDHHDVGVGVVGSVPDGARRPWPVVVEDGPEPGLRERVLVYVRGGGVVNRVVDDEHLSGEGESLEDPVQAGDDGLTFVVRGDDDADARFHIRTPSPTSPQMSATGTCGRREP